MQAPRILWIDLRSRRDAPSPHARLRALCTTLLLGIGDGPDVIESVSRLVECHRPALVFFEFDRGHAAGHCLVDRAQSRHPELPILMLTDETAGIDPRAADRARAGGWGGAALQPARADSSDRADRHGTRTLAAETYARANLAQRITLAAAAASCHLSKSEFSRAFKREHGETFLEFVLRLRTRSAAELLARGDLAVKEVAYAVGFNDVSYFGRVFRRHYGTAPSQYPVRPTVAALTGPVLAARDAAIEFAPLA